MSYYREIMDSAAPKQLKKYISTIDTLASRLDGVKVLHLTPDLFIANNNNYEHLLSLLCGYFSGINIIDFSGENKCISIRLEQPGELMPVSNICDKISDILALAGSFKGIFKGIICIDIKNIKYFNRDFREIIKYIKDKTPGSLRIVIAGHSREYIISDAEQALTKAGLRVYTVRNDVLSIDKAIIYFKIKLEEYGFDLNDKATESLKILLQQLIDSDKICNLNQVDDLCDDLLFFLLGNGIEAISPENIDSYFKKSILSNESHGKKHNIGFMAKGE